MSNRPNIQKPALRGSVAGAALLAVALWPWNLDTFAHNDSAVANKDFIPSPIILNVSAAASSRYVRIAMKDPEDILEDELEDALDDLEDALDDELDEDHSGSGDDFDDDFDDELDEDHSGSGGGGDDEDDFEDDLEEDHSGSGGGDDDEDGIDVGQEDDEDNSGSGSGDDDDDEDAEDNSGSGSGDDDDDDEDRSGSNSGSDHEDDDDDDRSGRHGGRDDDDDRSGSNSGSDHDDDLDYDEITDEDGFLAADRELLILVERSDLRRGDFADTDTEIEYELPALDLVMLRVRVSEDDDMFERLSELAASLGEDAVDLNHSYAADAASSEDEALAALLAVPVRLAGPLRLAEPLGLLPAGTVGLRIGIIDSGIDLSHRALSSAAIKTRNFANRGGPLSNAHGTMIAAIISGFEPGAYQGIAPGSEILAANIFFARPDGTAVANVEGMILALDWLVGENVPVVNMSVSGPPNRLLRRAIERAAAAGTIIVAAVGNAGPASPPLYPAAYGSVVAVTAIDSGGHIYRRAVRGSHVEFSAPGVDVFAASIADARAGADTGGYELQSGTSLAVPFVVVALAAVRQQDQRPWSDILSAFHAEAQDLGEAGFDPVFGYGLIRGIGAASETLYRPAGE